jgi:hypothetical protein
MAAQQREADTSLRAQLTLLEGQAVGDTAVAQGSQSPEFTIADIVGALRSPDVSQREEALALLSEIIDTAYGNDGAVIGEVMGARLSIALWPPSMLPSSCCIAPEPHPASAQLAEPSQAVRQLGGISVLGWMLLDPSTIVQQEALLVLGNLCSDAFDDQ